MKTALEALMFVVAVMAPVAIMGFCSMANIRTARRVGLVSVRRILARWLHEDEFSRVQMIMPITTAPEYLRRASEIMDERGKQYDSPGGERSMGRCVTICLP